MKNEEALAVIKETAQQLQAPIYTLNEQFFAKPHQGLFDYLGEMELRNVELAMFGEHQIANAALAITATKLFLQELDEVKIREALKKQNGKVALNGCALILY